ncbi:MAG TPA: folylpolyglutamate synthase/dihydrofolate synthase family protein [Verrucomicrobiae bacterium]|nr:folylpolyglutamate synthase/dihydrofolate synthase family protein [Verrucomicrobiae bacterium]
MNRDSIPGNPYSEAICFLYSLRWFGAKFGLENTFKLAALAGNPERNLKFIHVAGTNGKGSTCAILESIYRAAGLRVGLFTSPHLVSFRERIQINRELISPADVVRLVNRTKSFLTKFSDADHPTFFEAVTILALQYFAEQKCDLVIWETGLGGRLDATNIVTPLASVITNVQYDHQKWLGETLSSIAAEKAGIIKSRIPVVTGVEEPEAFEVISKIAAERSAPLTRVSRLPENVFSNFPLSGNHQRKNAELALTTIDVLQNRIPVSANAIRTGLSNVNWPGRLQLVWMPDGKRVLLDGAHNIAGAKVLADALNANFPNFPESRRTIILGILRDKDWRGICEIIAPLAGRIFTVPVQNERTATARELAEVCREIHPGAEIQFCETLGEALEQTRDDSFLVITGSLYLVGEAMEMLGISPVVAPDERALNEWGAANQNQNLPAG